MTQVELERLIAHCRQDSDILAVLLFGSAARVGFQDAGDVDICLVLMPRESRGRAIDLSSKRLDYLQRFEVDLHIFDQLPLYIRARVLREARILFVRDEAVLYAVALRTAQAFEDFKPLYRLYLEQVANARP